jgi:PAS domain S-box-containing protein
MELEEFGRRLEEALSQVRGLRHQSQDSQSAGWASATMSAFDELQVMMEMLPAVQAEARHQRDNLVSLEHELGRYRANFDVAPDACVMTDQRGVIHLVNRAAAELLGTLDEPPLSERLEAFVDERDRSGFVSALAAIPTSRGARRLSATVRPRHGPPVRAEIRGVAVQPYADEPPCIRWTLSDVTERRKAEAEVRRLNRELEMRVFQRTARLEAANKSKDQLLRRLRAAQAEAEAARRAAEVANLGKAEFLARLSHELRTPLNSIAGYAELLVAGVRGALNQAQREYMERIGRSQKHMQRLIEGIMNFATLELGRLTLDISILPVEQLLALADELTAPQAREKGVSCNRAHAGASLRCRTDREKAVQILVNLISNAVKFTDPGGTVETTIEARDDSLRLTVADAGPGIPPERLANVFDPFVSLTPLSSADRARGTGLGLAISRDLARAMGGELTVESTLGQGSRFTLSLPRA